MKTIIICFTSIYSQTMNTIIFIDFKKNQQKAIHRRPNTVNGFPCPALTVSLPVRTD
ncbi:hypothetical protein DDI_3055 [Dickeya dianthicola RNS04.9]|nr:hypothetical protein DDI_3055 [Dickeya dianthicola RNS04.9]